MNKKIIKGNAFDEGKKHRGWFVGSFIEGTTELPYSEDVEVKFTHHPKGEKLSSQAPPGNATTLGVLIKGKFKINFDDQEFTLEKEGDYLMYQPNIPHTNEALEDSVFLTVRWPSLSSKRE